MAPTNAGVRRLRVRAFAKINLSLQVAGVRPDGYHELRTIFQTIALHDTLTFAKTDGPFDIRSNDPRCPADETNLVWRAAERVWRAARRRGAPEGVRVRIHKRIPIAAGFGGGSSDAAAALTGLAKLWRVALDARRLKQLARGIGADVPFFLEGGTAIGTARGDTLRPLADAPPSWVVLVVPGFGVSTSDAYAWWDEDRRLERPSSVNDLQPPVAARHPEISAIVAALDRAGATQALMSGSGSAVFGLFEIRRTAERAARALDGPARQTIVTRTLDRASCRRLKSTWSRDPEAARTLGGLPGKEPIG